MKKHIKQYSTLGRQFSPLCLALILSLPLIGKAAGGDDEVKKKRTINKSYTVTAEDKLEINNSFGDVVVSTWDKNEITVDIEIGATASTEEKAQGIMDKIDVKEIHDGHIISLKTKIEHNNDNDEGNGNGKHHGDGEHKKSFYINYVIHMPAVNPMELENSFGKTTVPDFNGLITLTSKFGSLEAGKLTKVDEIDVEFGKAVIAEVSNGKLTFKFDQESEIGKVNGSVRINSEFSHNVKFNVANDIKELGVYESYSSVRMVVTKELSADFEVHTSFGSFNNDSDFGIKEEHEGGDNDFGPHFDKSFSGKAGDGKAKIKIKSSFGSVKLSHNWSGGDEKDKDKIKNKHKHKSDDDDDDDDDKSI
jgi:hypothetical protein